MVIASNRSLAEFNLSKEPHLSRRKQDIQQLSEEGEHLFNSIDGKSKEIGRWTSSVMYTLTVDILLMLMSCQHVKLVRAGRATLTLCCNTG